MNQLKIAYVLAAMLSLAVLNTPALAEPHHAKLVGFQEVPVVVTEGSGHFKMDIAPGDVAKLAALRLILLLALIFKHRNSRETRSSARDAK